MKKYKQVKQYKQENLKLPPELKHRVKQLARNYDISMVELITIWCDKEEARNASNERATKQLP